MLTSLYYHQLLGLCLGIDAQRLGITAQQLQATGLQRALRSVAKAAVAETISAA
jgi:heterodisulfide reductase subunit B